MILSSKPSPRRPRRVAGRLAAAAGALALAALALAACGGGTTQLEPFVPKRLLAFGDDNSALTQNGRRYGVNGLDTTTSAIDCKLNPIWVQSVAEQYGFVFAECNPTSEAEPKARMLAFAGAKVDDVGAQVEAQVAAGGFRDGDLATMLVGTNDLIELYDRYPSQDEPALLAEAGTRGKRLAQVVNRLVGLGVKVVVSDVPDLGVTPFAAKQDALGFGTGRAALLSRLTSAFNEQLGVNVLLDGRYIGLMQTQLRWQSIQRAPQFYSITNLDTGVCTATLPNCTTATVITDATPDNYLWADDTRLAPGGQAQLATLALERLARNPF